MLRQVTSIYVYLHQAIAKMMWQMYKKQKMNGTHVCGAPKAAPSVDAYLFICPICCVHLVHHLGYLLTYKNIDSYKSAQNELNC
jgi:hypothetical protein